MAGNLVIIPVYNEEESIRKLLVELRRYYDGAVLIVDDGSRDNTRRELRPWEQHGLYLIAHRENLGYGASLNDGLAYAAKNGYRLVVTMDCDFQHPPELVPEFFAECCEVDLLSGSRYLKPSPADDPPPGDRLEINRLVTERINALTGLGLTDAFCGFKAYKVEALKKLNLDERGYGWPLQFWIQAHARGLVVREKSVPRIYHDLQRSFGPALDDPDARLRYYMSVIDREVERWKLM